MPYLIGMPGKYIESSGKFMLKSRLLLSCWSHTRYYFNKKYDVAVPYGDAFLFCKGGNGIYEKIWTESPIKHFVFVHNNIKYANMFREKYNTEVSFVKIPEKNAFDNIDIIYAEVKSKIKNGDEMVLVSAGPCGKILVYRLARKGIWAIDTGHCWDKPLKR